jgi:hypothetical protein
MIFKMALRPIQAPLQWAFETTFLEVKQSELYSYVVKLIYILYEFIHAFVELAVNLSAVAGIMAQEGSVSCLQIHYQYTSCN